MKQRTATLEKYGISGKRYKELCGFCEQYPEWIEELRELNNPFKSKEIDGMPYSKTNNKSDPVANIAIKKAIITEKMELIESAAKKAFPDGDYYKAIIKSACYGKPFWYLRDIMQIPISERAFFDKRRYFFFLLSQKR